jgi:hypothetical protein
MVVGRFVRAHPDGCPRRALGHTSFPIGKARHKQERLAFWFHGATTAVQARCAGRDAV